MQFLVLWGDISYDGLLYTVARTQEVDVATQLRLGVRLLQAQAHMCVQILFFLLFSSVLIYYSSRTGKDISFCHNSQFTKYMFICRTINPNLLTLLYFSLRKSFDYVACLLNHLILSFRRVSSMVEKSSISSQKSNTSLTDTQTKL
jgi:hypothetical protein